MGYNSLTRLPTSIGQLTNLTTLYLDQNQLRDLPDSITQLKWLERIVLQGNPELVLTSEQEQ